MREWIEREEKAGVKVTPNDKVFFRSHLMGRQRKDQVVKKKREAWVTAMETVRNELTSTRNQLQEKVETITSLLE